ncbi:MAG: cytochrome b/b6 domain-containing protein [Magnetospirillum sp. WYHS-4]
MKHGNSSGSGVEVRVWDLPTRLFHWALVALVADAFLSAKFGDVTMTWHKWNGYAILTLLAFRLIWGMIGSSTARFADFVRGPRAIAAYLRGEIHPYGHNPLGALMVLALLAMLAFQGTMGLFATDDILVSGPLKHTVSAATAKRFTGLHKIGYWAILGLVAVHVGAVLAYLLVRKENLTRPMITGYKSAAGHAGEPFPTLEPLWRAGLALALAASIVWGGVNGWPLLAH